MDVKEKVYNSLWNFGTRTANVLQRSNFISGRCRKVLRKAGHLVVPPVPKEAEYDLPWGSSIVVPGGFRGIRSYIAGTYEQELTKFVGRTLASGMIFVDIGSLLGYYSLLAASKVGSSGQVWAFEPEPVAYGYLEKNVSNNGFDFVKTFNIALSDHQGNAKFKTSSEDGYGVIGGALTDDVSCNSISVPIKTLDALWQEQGSPQIDLMKVDVDGREPEIFRGMSSLLEDCSNLKIVVEYDPSHCEQIGSCWPVLDILRKNEFLYGWIIERGMKPVDLSKDLPDYNNHYNILCSRNKDLNL